MKKRGEVFHNNLVEENMMQNPEYLAFMSFCVKRPSEMGAHIV
jgi:hypothetical protein